MDRTNARDDGGGCPGRHCECREDPSLHARDRGQHAGQSAEASAGRRVLEAPGMIRRLRRMANISQRQLAQLLGVSQSTVARWETGQGTPSVARFVEIATVAGVDVRLADGSGSVVVPMREDAIRDGAGRRFPAHVDVDRPSWRVTFEDWSRGRVLDAERRSRERGDVRMGYTTGWMRALLRSVDGVPPDHPARADVLRVLADQDARRPPRDTPGVAPPGRLA